MTENDESLVVRRSRRTTAGNRMEAALAELALEDLSKDAGDDIDFKAGKDEEDVFESDFESTDEEAMQEDVDAGDKAVQEEEKKARKAVRSRVEKATAIAHARQKVTFNPQASSPSKDSKILPKTKRRVSLGAAINVETGEVIESAKRQSRRRHTILNTSATVSRMRDAEERKAAVPKKVKVQTRTFTQDELIARALDTEEGNIVEHRDYLKLEEEKRKRARVVRPTISGPVLRWISRSEETKVVVDPPVAQSHYRTAYAYGYTVPAYQNANGSNTTAYTAPPYAYYYATQAPTQQLATYPVYVQPTPLQSGPSVQTTTTSTPHQQTPQSPASTERIEKVTKNYLVHELGQSDMAPKPSWKDSMGAMFGDHVQWENVKVYTGKGRPLARPKQTCPLTGLAARYLDPRTRVPYANTFAYQTLTKILSHEYIWSDALGCYVARVGEDNALGPVGEPPRKRRQPDLRTPKSDTVDTVDISRVVHSGDSQTS